MKEHALVKGETTAKQQKYIDKIKNPNLHNHWTNFNQTQLKASLGEGNSYFFPFPRADNRDF